MLWWQEEYLYFVFCVNAEDDITEINLVCLPKMEIVWIDFEPRIKHAERPIRA